MMIPAFPPAPPPNEEWNMWDLFWVVDPNGLTWEAGLLLAGVVSTALLVGFAYLVVRLGLRWLRG